MITKTLRKKQFLQRFKWSLFLMAFMQVGLVSSSTVFISTHNHLGTFLVGFGISWLWTSNVKKVAFGGKADRFVYALGDACGSLVGLVIASQI
jgi:hypothetical protein